MMEVTWEPTPAWGAHDRLIGQIKLLLTCQAVDGGCFASSVGPKQAQQLTLCYTKPTASNSSKAAPAAAAAAGRCLFSPALEDAGDRCSQLPPRRLENLAQAVELSSIGRAVILLLLLLHWLSACIAQHIVPHSLAGRVFTKAAV
jgi:hypothetical protein